MKFSELIPFAHGCTVLHQTLHQSGLSCKDATLKLRSDVFDVIALEITGNKKDASETGYLAIGGLMVVRDTATNEEIVTHRKDLEFSTMEVQGNA